MEAGSELNMYAEGSCKIRARVERSRMKMNLDFEVFRKLLSASIARVHGNE